MTTTLKKLSALLLALGTIFILSFPSLAHAADTGGSDHFELTVVENKDSKSGTEIADLTIKNISSKTGTNVTFEADLPTILQDKDMKKATFNVGTLKAGESKTYKISRKADGTVDTTPLPQTGNNQSTSGTSTSTKSTTSLPTTGEATTPLLITFGLLLVAGLIFIGLKRFQGAKHLLAILLLLVGLGGAATANAAEKSYHHRDEVRNHAVELVGVTHVFHLAGEGDFEGEPGDNGGNSGDKGETGDKGESGDKGEQGDKGESGGPSVTDNYTITYYVDGQLVTTLDPDGYRPGVKTVHLPTPKLAETLAFLGWYDNANCTGIPITTIGKTEEGDKVFYGKTSVAKYTVTFDTKGGTAIAPQLIGLAQTATQPLDPKKNDTIKNVVKKGVAPDSDFALEGWYTDAACTKRFDFKTIITSDLTLHAKWQLLITDAGENNRIGDRFANRLLGDRGDTVWLANAWWRIVNADIDSTVVGKQALLVKEEALTNKELGIFDDYTQFRQNEAGRVSYHEVTGPTWDPITGHRSLRFFTNDTTSTGYDDSIIKQKITDYYTNTIANSEQEALVLPVSLNNLTFSQWQTKLADLLWSRYEEVLPSGTYDDYFITQENQFEVMMDAGNPTTLGGQKQAFALGMGDIRHYQLEDQEVYTSNYVSLSILGGYLDEGHGGWSRSPFMTDYHGGTVSETGRLSYYEVDSPNTVRPAIVVQID